MIKAVLSTSKTILLGFITALTIGSFLTLSASALTPYFNVFNGDVVTGDAGFGNSCGSSSSAGILGYNVTNNGSATNLAALAPSVINGFQTSSGIAPNGGSLSPFFSSSASDPLTFANTTGTFGGYYGATSTCMTDYYSLTSAVSGLNDQTLASSGPYNLSTTPTNPFGPGLCITPPVPPSTPPAPPTVPTTYCWVTPPPSPNHYIQINASSFSGNLVVFVNGDVDVNTNISLSSSYSNTNDIPNLYVIASGNINIASGVNTLDGVYVAEPTSIVNQGGYITTCATTTDTQWAASALTTNCGGVLNVDGSFQAKQVRLNRTGGDVATTAAENFTFDPSIWINNPLGNIFPSSGGNPNYLSVSNLPPVL